MQFRALLSIFLASSTLAIASPTRGNGPVTSTMTGSFPLKNAGFEENKGQVRTTKGGNATHVRYRLDDAGTTLFLLEDGIAYQFERAHYPEGPDASTNTIEYETYRMNMVLEGARPDPPISAEDPTPGLLHYYTRNTRNVRSFRKITYHDVYPHIDWVIHVTEKGVKYDFVVRPGGDVDRIRLRFEHQEELRIDGTGSLIHGNRLGRFVEAAPVSFQAGGAVATKFVLDGNVLRFDVGAFDTSLPLTIDPDRIWGTYFGQTFGTDNRAGCALGPDGAIHLTGVASSSLDIAENGHQMTHGGGGNDAFLAKFDPNGILEWATFYGGDASDVGNACAVDANGNVFLAGTTRSTNGIAAGGHQLSHGSTTPEDATDAFLVKFNSDGERLWGTYYGGTVPDLGNSCATDADGNVYLAGETSSLLGISFDGHQTSNGGGQDAFLVKFNADGVRQWASFYGGTAADIGWSCATAANGDVLLCGQTASTDAITFPGAFQESLGGGFNDAFLVRFSTSGTRLWSTYYGGLDRDRGFACTVGANGDIYLAGETLSQESIWFAGHQQFNAGGALGSGGDAFLTKFTPDGMRVWGTYYGGTSSEQGSACTVDAMGNVYLAGRTASDDAIADEGLQNDYSGVFDAFLVKFNADGVREWGTYYGGNEDDRGHGCVASNDGSIYLCGQAGSPTGIAQDGHQMTAIGQSAFLAKLDAGPSSGIRDHNSINAHLWPNPATDDALFIRLPLDWPLHNVEVAIHDITGRTVRDSGLGVISDKQSLRIQLDRTLKNGAYLLSIQANGRTLTERFVIRR
ncbi:MAG TPA: T9SS type A sorting domain-containing protein [Flavobacteriales bacterium]|nr:T9SS type A sorting domain-containing protein [Flavobacteriales bacterium]